MPDVTAPLVNWVTDMIGSHGVWMVGLLMTLESACIPIPSEVVQLFGGFLVGQHKANLFAIIAAGVIGNVVGSLVAYWVGATKGRAWALRWHWLHITPERLDMADRWFAKWGSGAVLVSRCLPVIRTFISLPAGVAKMPLGKFTLLTTLGCIPWVTGLTLLGRYVGKDWESLQHKLHYIDYAIVLAIIGAVAWLIVRNRRSRAAVA